MRRAEEEEQETTRGERELGVEKRRGDEFESWLAMAATGGAGAGAGAGAPGGIMGSGLGELDAAMRAEAEAEAALMRILGS